MLSAPVYAFECGHMRYETRVLAVLITTMLRKHRHTSTFIILIWATYPLIGTQRCDSVVVASYVCAFECSSLRIKGFYFYVINYVASCKSAFCVTVNMRLFTPLVSVLYGKLSTSIETIFINSNSIIKQHRTINIY